MMRSPSLTARPVDIGKPFLLPETRPAPRVLVLLSVGWFLVVLTVQPWIATVRTTTGVSAEESELGKGLLTAVVFLCAVAIAAPRFRIIVPPTYGLYLVYLMIAVSAAVYSGTGSVFLRAGRMAMVIAVPALLWPWLIGDPEGFVRLHRRAHMVLAASVLGGLLMGGAAAWEFGIPFGEGGRLQGVVPPLTAVRVGEVGAVLGGLGLIGVAFRRIRLLPGLGLVLLGVALIALSHTRTAAAAIVAGLIAASLSVARSRQGRWALTSLVLVLLAGVACTGPITSWILREQTPDQFTTLTGRWAAWESVVQKEFTRQEILLGHGLGSKTLTLEPNTLPQRWLEIQRVKPIDSGWLSVYWESGVVGVVLVFLALAAAFVFAWRAPTQYVRAVCVYLLTIVVVASFVETGLSDMSSLTLHVLVASGAAYGDRLVARSRSPLLQTES